LVGCNVASTLADLGFNLREVFGQKREGGRHPSNPKISRNNQGKLRGGENRNTKLNGAGKV